MVNGAVPPLRIALFAFKETIMTPIKKPQDLSKFDRISIINRHIKDIQQTVYPDNYQEVKQTVVKALEDRIDAIVDGRV